VCSETYFSKQYWLIIIEIDQLTTQPPCEFSHSWFVWIFTRNFLECRLKTWNSEFFISEFTETIELLRNISCRQYFLFYSLTSKVKSRLTTIIINSNYNNYPSSIRHPNLYKSSSSSYTEITIRIFFIRLSNKIERKVQLTYSGNVIIVNTINQKTSDFM
jgi:hypothetical protein